MPLDVINLQADWIIASGDIGLVGVGEIAHQAVVVKFEIIVLKILLKDDVGSVGSVHDEFHILDVIPTKGISYFNGELHLSEVWTVVRGPLKLLSIVPVTTVGSVAAVDPDAGARQGVGHDLKARITTGTLHLPKGDVHGTIATSSAYAACAPSAGDLSIDSDFQLLALGDHEPVGTCVKFYLDDGPVAATIG